MLLKQFIKETIDNNEPRADIIDIDVSDDPDNNNVNISCILQVINNTEPVQLNLVIERIR